jgi:hypothetical protein
MNNENRRIFFIGARKATSGRQAPNVAVTAAKPCRYRRDTVNIMILLDRVDYRWPNNTAAQCLGLRMRPLPPIVYSVLSINFC